MTQTPVARDAASPALPAAGSGKGGYNQDDGPGDNPPPSSGFGYALPSGPRFSPPPGPYGGGVGSPPPYDERGVGAPPPTLRYGGFRSRRL